jgi:CBS domain-containing protein
MNDGACVSVARSLESPAMAVQVAEVMNHELFGVRTSDGAREVIGLLLAYGVTSAPVLDGDGKAVGVIALRDLIEAPAGDRVQAHMTVPADSVSTRASIQDAAAQMTRNSRHHLVCVDDDGRAVGFIGTLDVLRGLLGEPAPHPTAFPHRDPASGLAWSDDACLTSGNAQDVPAVPGVFVLVEAEAGTPNKVVWSEGTEDLRRRLRDLLTRPGEGPPHLLDAAVSCRLWFRYAVVNPSRVFAPSSATP